MSRDRNPDEFPESIDEIDASQPNVVLPDLVGDARSVDAFLWKGSPNPTRVQRTAARILGVVEMGLGLEIFALAVRDRVRDGFSFGVVIEVAVALAAVLLGSRTFRNGFPRLPKPAQNSD
jgi:hypothetical protein